ncbi:MAG: oligosaccharide flippase family protein [Nitrosospira sp.]
MGTQQHYSVERVRRGTLHFLGGKAGSAALTFAAFILVARLLTTTDYAYYAIALAVVELGLALASFGLDWVAARYLPEYRVRATGSQLKHFILKLAGLQSAIYLVFAILMGLGSFSLAALLGSPSAAPVLQLYSIYLVMEGCSRMLRDQMLGHLLLQGRAQIALILRNLIWVSGLAWFYTHGSAAAVQDVALVEVAAALVGLLAAVVGLFHTLRGTVGNLPGSNDGWIAPTLQKQWVLARSSYLSYLFSLAYGPQVITLLLSRFAGVEVTAAFGFARNLADQVRRYLPADLLLGLVRPALVARYAASQNFTALNRNATLLFLISLLVLAPVLVLGIVYGDLVVMVLSSGKFGDSAPFVTLLLLLLAPFSHRRIIEMIANTVSHAAACARANAYLIGFPPLMALLLMTGLPVWSVLLVLLLAEMTFSFLVVRELRKGGMTYQLPWAALLRIVLAVALSAGVLSMLNIALDEGLVDLLIATVLALLVTATVLLLCKPLDRDALESIKRLLGRTNVA